MFSLSKCPFQNCFLIVSCGGVAFTCSIYIKIQCCIVCIDSGTLSRLFGTVGICVTTMSHAGVLRENMYEHTFIQKETTPHGQAWFL